jgi:hypothetical protein
VELRGPYSSEVRLLEGVLRGLEKLPAVPLMAERSFDAVGLMQRVKELGCSVAIGVKETWGCACGACCGRSLSKDGSRTVGSGIVWRGRLVC